MEINLRCSCSRHIEWNVHLFWIDCFVKALWRHLIDLHSWLAVWTKGKQCIHVFLFHSLWEMQCNLKQDVWRWSVLSLLCLCWRTVKRVLEIDEHFPATLLAYPLVKGSCKMELFSFKHIFQTLQFSHLFPFHNLWYLYLYIYIYTYAFHIIQFCFLKIYIILH